jgi:hypothetical protein
MGLSTMSEVLKKKKDATDPIQILRSLKQEIAKLQKEIKEKKTPDIPNIRSLFQAPKNEQAELTRKLLTSDEDNYTKARTPSAFAMTVFDQIGPWLAGEYKSIGDMLSPKPSKPNEPTFNNLYRVNSIALRGQSRDEYVSVMQPIGLNADMLQFRMSEKAKLKEGNRK